MDRISALVVEDDSRWQDIVREVLEQSGADVDVASDYPQARTLLDRHTYDMVTLDMSLGADDEKLPVSMRGGWRLLAHHVQQNSPGTHVYVISGSLEEDQDRRQALRHAFRLGTTYGVRDFAPKDDLDPATIREWVEHVRQAAGRRLEVETHRTTDVNQESRGQAFDVFLCHNSQDKPSVDVIRKLLQDQGIRAWLDKSDLPPFEPFVDSLDRAIAATKSAAIFLGPSGKGPWQDLEVKGFLRQYARRKIRMGLVLLPGSPDPDDLDIPGFLSDFMWVDFRQSSRDFSRTAPDHFDRILWAITGDQP